MTPEEIRAMFEKALAENRATIVKEVQDQIRASAPAEAPSAPPVQTPPPAPAPAPQQQQRDPNAERFGAILETGANQNRDGGAGSSPAPTFIKPAERQDLEPGIRAARMVRAMAAARGNVDRAIAIIADRYHDRHTAEMASRALEAGTPSAGGYLVPQDFLAELIPYLRNFSVLMKLGIREIPMPGGTLKIPRLAAGATAVYVGEAEGANAVQPTLGDVNLSAKKMRALVPISNDLLVVNSIAVDEMVRDDLAAAVAEKTDYGGLMAMGSDNEPRGLFRQPTNIITDVTVNGVITSDTPALFKKALMDSKVVMRKPGWTFNPTVWEDLYGLKATTGTYIYRDEMDKGMLLGYPFEISQQITNGVDANAKTWMALGDWSEYLMGLTRQLELAFSTEAAYKNASGTLVGAFDEDVSLVRAITSHDFAPRQGKAFAISDDVHTVA